MQGSCSLEEMSPGRVNRYSTRTCPHTCLHAVKTFVIWTLLAMKLKQRFQFITVKVRKFSFLKWKTRLKEKVQFYVFGNQCNIHKGPSRLSHHIWKSTGIVIKYWKTFTTLGSWTLPLHNFFSMMKLVKIEENIHVQRCPK